MCEDRGQSFFMIAHNNPLFFGISTLEATVMQACVTGFPDAHGNVSICWRFNRNDHLSPVCPVHLWLHFIFSYLQTKRQQKNKCLKVFSSLQLVGEIVSTSCECCTKKAFKYESATTHCG